MMEMRSQDQDRFRSFAGHFLLAMPDMPDPSFLHAVIALCVHDSDGAMGVDLGSPIEGLGLHDLMNSFGIEDIVCPDVPVLRGGPVEPRRGFVLHSLDWAGEHMVPVGQGWGITGSLEILKDIAAGKGPARYVAALGYSGWGPGQLDGEISRPGWFVGAADRDILFDVEPENRWKQAFAFNGIDPYHITAQSGHA